MGIHCETACVCLWAVFIAAYVPLPGILMIRRNFSLTQQKQVSKHRLTLNTGQKNTTRGKNATVEKLFVELDKKNKLK